MAGIAPAGTTVVEAKAEPGVGLRGKAIDWAVVAQVPQINCFDNVSVTP